MTKPLYSNNKFRIMVCESTLYLFTCLFFTHAFSSHHCCWSMQENIAFGKFGFVYSALLGAFFSFDNGRSMDLIQSQPMCIENPFKNIRTTVAAEATAEAAATSMAAVAATSQNDEHRWLRSIRLLLLWHLFIFFLSLNKALEKSAQSCIRKFLSFLMVFLGRSMKLYSSRFEHHLNSIAEFSVVYLDGFFCH